MLGITKSFVVLVKRACISLTLEKCVLLMLYLRSYAVNPCFLFGATMSCKDGVIPWTILVGNQRETLRWKELNVHKQIDQMVEEETLLLLHGSELKHRQLMMSHITIPAAYKSGITLFVLKGSKAHKLLEDANELPLLMSACREAQSNEELSSCEMALSINV